MVRVHVAPHQRARSAASVAPSHISCEHARRLVAVTLMTKSVMIFLVIEVVTKNVSVIENEQFCDEIA
jgi:hypothetical protein